MSRRIFLTVVAACALGVAVLFVPMALVVRAQNQHIDLLELQRLSAVASRNAPADLGATTGWPPADPDPQHRYARYDAAGVRIAGDGPETADLAVREALRNGEANDTTADEIVVATALDGSGQIAGAVRVAEPIVESNARTAADIAWISALALAAVAVAAAAGWWLLRRLLDPVTALRAAADRLGRGDFGVTVPTTGLAEFDDVGRALARSAERIGQLMERERAFSADASHQLRTPLAATMVALETELLAPRPDRRAVVRESLQALTRLEGTVNDLIRLARDVPGPRGAFDLTSLLDAVRRHWTPRYQAADRVLTVPRPAGSVSVAASEAALRQVLDVLLDNALAHGRGEVSVASILVAGGVAVTVTDGGHGPARPDRMFRRRDSGAAGTGIGLALARSLAEAEGARLTVRSGAPTTFELLIPLADASATGSGAGAGPPAAAGRSE